MGFVINTSIRKVCCMFFTQILKITYSDWSSMRPVWVCNSEVNAAGSRVSGSPSSVLHLSRRQARSPFFSDVLDGSTPEILPSITLLKSDVWGSRGLSKVLDVESGRNC